MESDGGNPRRLTGGLKDRGVDHPVWLAESTGNQEGRDVGD
jgi:hypothetical protein